MNITCSKCNQPKTLEDFHKDKSKKNGHQSTCKACRKAYARANPEKFAKANRRWAERHPEEAKARWRDYQIANRGKFAAHGRKYKAAKINRTPKWVDLGAILEFYEACPIGYHVDHIIPLQGKNVSGLHVLGNLQYLPARTNISKSNTFENAVVS